MAIFQKDIFEVSSTTFIAFWSRFLNGRLQDKKTFNAMTGASHDEQEAIKN
jgi:hypothetical protein